MCSSDLEDIIGLNNQMIKNQSELGTLASEIKDKTIYENQNIVKAITTEKLDGINFPQGIDFQRKITKNIENIYHHLGIYCYQKETLKNFVSFKQSPNEAKYKLEQLRALENKMRIDVGYIDACPLSVDTEEDLKAIKELME